jgi:hypothetical protein
VALDRVRAMQPVLEQRPRHLQLLKLAAANVRIPTER